MISQDGCGNIAKGGAGAADLALDIHLGQVVVGEVTWVAGDDKGTQLGARWDNDWGEVSTLEAADEADALVECYRLAVFRVAQRLPAQGVQGRVAGVEVEPELEVAGGSEGAGLQPGVAQARVGEELGAEQGAVGLWVALLGEESRLIECDGNIGGQLAWRRARVIGESSVGGAAAIGEAAEG